MQCILKDLKRKGEKIQWSQKLFFEKKINKIDKPLARLTKEKRERTKIINFRNEIGDITTDPRKGISGFRIRLTHNCQYRHILIQLLNFEDKEKSFGQSDKNNESSMKG